ncbi:peptidoglycan DD-metalloendopeptidase family protein [Streptomyces physcomitrii]
MNDRHPSGFAPAPAPDAASTAHGLYDQTGQQGNYPGYDGTGSYPVPGFDADPLFGEMPGSGYDTGSWGTTGGYPAAGSAQDPYPYATPEAAYGTGSHDGSGTWAASAQEARVPAQYSGPEDTGQWQQSPFDPAAFDGSGFDAAGFAQQTGQFDTRTFDPSGYASLGYETQSHEMPGFAPQAFETQGFDSQSFGTQGLESQGFEPPHIESPGYATGNFATQSFEVPGHAQDFGTQDQYPGFPHPGYEGQGHPAPEAYGTASFETHGYPTHDGHPSHEGPQTGSHPHPEAYGTHSAYEAPGGYASGAPYETQQFDALGYPTGSFPAQHAEGRAFAEQPFETGGGTGHFETGSFETGTYETTGFDTATFEAIYEAPAYEDVRHDSGPADHRPAPDEAHEVAPAGPEASGGEGHTGELPRVSAGHPADPAGGRARSRARRRTPSKRSALLTVAVPSACVMGVAGIAAASVGDFGEGDTAEAQASAPDPASVRPSVANNKLDSQLQGLSADAGDFADRASRTQERIDLKAKQEAERKKAAEEAERKERLRPKFVLPVKQHGLSAYYGQAGVNWMSVHTGIDFPVSYGTPVMAATDGTVRTQYNTAYGNMAIVTAEDGTETWYCHLSSHKVFSGSVKAGDTIAFSGNSGNSTGPHLHFEVRPGGGSAVNPLPWLNSHGVDPQ